MTACSVWNAANAAVDVGGVSPLVSALGNGDTNQQNDSFASSCSVGVKFDTDGEEYEYNPNGSFTATIGTWLDQGTSSQVWVEYLRSGGTQTKWDNRNNNQRYQINIDVNFIIVDTISSSGGAETITGQFRFWDAATGGSTLQTTASATYSARLFPDPCPLCCFTPDTPVTLASGIEVPIGKIRMGAMILVWDEAAKKHTTQAITGIIVREKRAMYRVDFSDDRYVRVSDDHPFSVRGKGPASINPVIEYKQLGLPAMLEIGDVVPLQDTTQVRVTGFTRIEFSGPVYTLENSLFYANGLLVY